MVTKENKIKIIKYIWYTAGTVCLLMAPVASYFMFEYVTGIWTRFLIIWLL